MDFAGRETAPLNVQNYSFLFIAVHKARFSQYWSYTQFKITRDFCYLYSSFNTSEYS